MHQLDWNATINTIRETLPQAQFLNWFKPMELIRCENRTVVLGVPSRFHEEWVRNNYSQQIQQAIRQQVGTDVQLEFEILVQEENIEASLASPAPLSPAIAPRPSLRIVPNPADGESDAPPAAPKAPQLPVFSHPFLQSPYSHVAYQCVGLFASGRDARVNPLILYGGVGMGKTHLLTEAGRRLHEQSPRTRIRYTNAESFTAEMFQALKSNTMIEFKRKFRDETDCLLFDDIQGLTRRIKTQEELLHTFNELISRGGKVAFTTSVPVHGLEEFIEPLRSRLLAGVIAEIKYPTFEEKVALLAQMSAMNHITIEGPVIRSLADKGQKDIRELIGTLLRAHLQAKLENRPLDNSFLAQEGWIRDTQKEVVTLAEIVSLVEHNFGVARTDLVSKSRKGATTWARQVAMYLARTYTLLPLEVIGKALGRDHATVIHAFQKVTDTMKTQPTRRYEVEFLKQKLENRSPRPASEEAVPPDQPSAFSVFQEEPPHVLV